jgi:hypothetical protein
VSLNKKMGDAHEKYVVDLLGGRQTRGSGNQWQNPADGRQSRYEHDLAFAWDCKSTYGKSIGVTRDMWRKIMEQASPETPLLPLRFYDPASGTANLDPEHDLVVLDFELFAEILEGYRNYGKALASGLLDPDWLNDLQPTDESSSD